MYVNRYSQDRNPSVVYAILFGLVVIALIGFIVASVATTGTSVKVIGHRWERFIDIQAWTTVREEGWSIPQGGREVSHRSKERSTIKIGDVSVPVMGTWYTFDIERWRFHSKRSAGNTDRIPHWPDVSDVRTSNSPQVGELRVADHVEHYYLMLSHDADEESQSAAYTYELPEASWAKIQSSQFLVAKVNAFGTVRDIVTIEGE